MGASDSGPACIASQNALLGLVRPLVIPVGDGNRAPPPQPPRVVLRKDIIISAPLSHS